MNTAISSENVQNVDVLIVANFASTDGSRNCRFGEIATRLTALGADVELATSNFEHDDHTFRKNPVVPQGHKLTLVHEAGYSRNISLKRLVSQYVFARNLTKYLAARPAVPDAIYCALPSPAAARVCAQFAQQHGIPLVLDIQDLWPEAFGMRFSAPRLIKLLFSPMNQASRQAYHQADLVVGVSQTYITAAEHTAEKSLPSSVVYLGSSLNAVEPSGEPDEAARSTEAIRIVYAGTLSHSYDLPMVIDAMESLRMADDRFESLELVIVGDGPLRADFEEYAKRRNVQVRFLGFLSYRDMMTEIRNSDIAVNPIVAGSAGSVLNKVGDYAAASIPVINTQESAEYRELLEQYGAGINCDVGKTSQVAAAIRELVENPSSRIRMGDNNRRMAEELFDRDKTYAALAQKVMRLAGGGVLHDWNSADHASVDGQ